MIGALLTRALCEATTVATTASEEQTETIMHVDDVVEKTSKTIEALEKMVPKLINFGLSLLIGLIIFAIGKIIISIVVKIINRFFKRTSMEISVRKFLISFVKAVLYIVLILIICNQIGIKTTSFIAVLGSAGIAVGLALQGSLANFAGGVLILILKPFKVGDYIVVEKGSGNEGTVEKIDLCYTALVTNDNRTIVIPNGTLSNASLINVTGRDIRRVDFEIGIAYNSDISLAKKVIEETARENEQIIKDKEIFTFVSSLDASQVTLGVRVWCNTSDYWNVKFDMNEQIKIKLDENNIEIPFNQLVVHMDK